MDSAFIIYASLFMSDCGTCKAVFNTSSCGIENAQLLYNVMKRMYRSSKDKQVLTLICAALIVSEYNRERAIAIVAMAAQQCISDLV